METKQCEFNKNIGLKILLLLGFATFYVYTIVTGSVKLYVHPRIIPYMIFAAIVMAIISALLMGQLFKRQPIKTNSWSLLFYIIPLLMAFALPPKTFNSSTGTTASLDLSAGPSISENAGESSQQLGQEKNPTESTSANENSDKNKAKDAPENGINLQNGVIVMDGNNFYKCLSEIHENIDKYESKPIEVVGFVFSDSEFSSNQFVAARLMMVCCAADMVPVGFMCRYDKTQDLEKDSWVKVNGIIHRGQFQGNMIPVIDVFDVQKADKPKDYYVYPY